MAYNTTLQRPDFIVSSATGEEQLLIEVKTWRPENQQLNQLVESNFAARPYFFLFITPEEMLLWSPAGPGQAVEPRKASTSEVLANYLTIERYPLKGLSEQELSLVASSWLGSIMFKPRETLLTMHGQAWVVESGLHERIYRGFIRREQLFR
jgi:hypothetical protein